MLFDKDFANVNFHFNVNKIYINQFENRKNM